MTRTAPIFHFNEQRSDLVAVTIDRVVASIDDPLHELNDAAYCETRRLDGSRRKKDQEALDQWRSIAKRVGRMSAAERKQMLRELSSEYCEDIAGNFDPRVFDVSTRLVPTLVTSLLAPLSLPRMLREPGALFELETLKEKVVVEGNIEPIARLCEIGTCVFVPTHSSNLDSIVFGFALEASGLPPATYGAGKNLFTNRFLSFFMHNLGAYKVDRRLRHDLYKRCLKTYSTVLLEKGFHSLFFPGGTRSRSGGVEQHLKLGLMGTGIEAYTRTLLAGKERKIFFVPATINYLIALEAETLIADYLSESGKARYIIEDDESTRLGRVASFVRKLLGRDASVVIRFGAPFDPFGNEVDDQGVSHDRRGRPVQPSSYVTNVRGEVVIDPARDAQYTRELGREVAAAFRNNTVVMPTHLVAAACFDHLVQRAPRGDVFTVLRVRDEVVDRDTLAREVVRLRDLLLDLEKAGQIHLVDGMRRASGGDIVAQAIAAFSGYHRNPVIAPRPDGIALRDTNLLFYYQNRLAAHGLAYASGRPAYARSA